LKKRQKEIVNEFVWLDRIIKKLPEFKPVVSKVTSNYREMSSNVLLSIEFNDHLQRSIPAISIPSTGDVAVISLKNMYFEPIDVEWEYNIEKMQWETNTKSLPGSDRFFLEVSGPTSKNFLSNHVDIEKAIQRNRERDDTCDSYWLCVSLCQTEEIEKISRQFEIDEVNVEVGVKVGNHIAPEFPDPIENMLKCKADWELAIDSKKRDINRIRARYQRAARESSVSFDELVKILNDVVDPNTFYNYLNTEPVFIDEDNKYHVCNVKRADNEMPPNRMLVESRTNLSLKNQNPKGYLKFHKNKFKDDLAEKLGVEKEDEEQDVVKDDD